MEHEYDAILSDAGRRRFLKQAGAAVVVGLLGGGKARASTPHAMLPAEATLDFNPDVEMELAAVVDEVGLLPARHGRLAIHRQGASGQYRRLDLSEKLGSWTEFRSRHTHAAKSEGPHFFQ